MPNIDKVKKTKKKKLKKTNLPAVKTVAKKTKTKKDVVAYYNCLLTKVQSGWYDPTTGKKKQITACCKDCSANAPKLQEQRGKEITKLITSYQQVGDSLKKLLQPIK